MGRGLPYDDLDLWLATALPDYALLATTRRARARGLVASWSPRGISTLIDGAAADRGSEARLLAELAE
jgi:protein-L-isoaspartate(D-aspartate) O-methyltransferase